MTESITREEAERRFDTLSFLSAYKHEVLEALYPPQTTFKSGEVIAVSRHPNDNVKYRRFITMAPNGFYRCELENKPRHTFNWEFARPQTDEEKGK